MADRLRLTALVVATLSACALAAASAAATPPSPQQALAAYRACLKQHGVSFLGGGGKRPTAAELKKLQPALKACRSKLRAGFTGRPGGPGGFRNNPAFQKYTACLRQHGLTFTPGTRPDRTSAKYKAAAKACASLRPKQPAG